MAVQVNVSADQKKLVDSINKGVNAYNRRFASSNSINLKINERSFTQPLGRISGAVDDFGAAMAASNARVIAFGASTAVLGSAVAGFRSLARASIEVEKNLADVNRILQLTTSDLQTFGKELFNISKRTATSFNDASKALLEFSRQGLDASETLKRTNDALTLTRLAGLGAEASVAALTATVNGFSKSGITTTQVLNKLVAVEQSFAVSARDLSQGLARTGQAAQEAGVDIDQLNALISAAQQKTARGGAVIGNALKTIFTRLQRSDTLDRLEEFNVAVRDVQGNTLPAALILQNFAASYDKLADAQRAQLSEQVAGVYQVNILKAIISDLNSEQSIYNGALAKGSQATNEAARANAQLNQTLSALLVQTGNNAQQLASTIGSVTFEPLAKSAAKAANSILETFTGLLTGEGLASDFANGLLKGIRNVLGGPGAVAAFYTLFKLVQNSFTYVAQALPQLAGITTETQKRQSLEQAILGILQQENAVSKALVGTTGNQKRQAEILLGVAKQQTAEYQKQKTIASGLAATLRTQGVSVGSRGLQTGKTRSGGFIPNATKQAERSGALAGGYMPGKVINSPVGGVMNTAEQVKYVPGFAQPFINPPKTSRAGRLHRVESLRQTGVNPYMYDGFVPNFASLSKGKMNLGDLAKYSRSRTELLNYAEIDRKKNKLSKNNINLNDQVKYGFDKVVKFDATKVKGFKRLTNVKDSGYSNEEFGEKFEQAIIKSKQFGDIQRAHRLKGGFGSAVDMVNKGTKITKLIEAKGGGYDSKITPFKTARAIAENLGNDKFKKLFTSPNKETLRNQTLLIENANYPTVKNKPSKGKRHDGFIPNFAAAYRNTFTGKLNNSAIARGLKSGALSASEAAAMGYTTSGSKIDTRKAKRASFINSLNYKQVYVPWDIEAFRAKGSAAKGQTFNQTQGSTYEKYILNSLRSGIKGTTSLGAPFALPARPDAINGNLLKGKTNSRIDGYSLSAGEMYEMKSGDKGDTLAGLQNKFIDALKKNPEILNPKRKWKNYIFRTTKAKGRGASNGFIPNLAYKGEVMDLEESISGEKAIYSNTPFPHVRNASQPTFASAIADHGGLSNALKDSYGNQSAAGMVYGGFVPNFAPKDTITAQAAGIGDLSKSGSQLQQSFYQLQGAMRKLKTTTDLTTDQRNNLRQDMRTYARAIDAATGSTKALDSVNDALAQSKKKNKTAVDRNTSANKKNTQQQKSNTGGGFSLKGAGTALAFAGPMLAGIAEQAAFGNRERINMSTAERATQSVFSTGLTTASTAFSIGSQFGTPGLVLAGIATAGITAASALGAMSLSAEEYTQILDNYNTKTKESTTAAQNYIKAQQVLAKSISSEDMQTASEALKTNFKNIKDINLQKAFSEAGDDVGKLTESLEKYEKERGAGANRRQQAVFAAELSAAESGTGVGRKNKTAEAKNLEKLGIETVATSTSNATGSASEAGLVLTEQGTQAALNQFSQLFEDVSGMTTIQIANLSQALEEEASGLYFSSDRITNILKEGGLSIGVAALNAELFDQLEEDGNLVGNAIINNFRDFYVRYTKQVKASGKKDADNEAARKLREVSVETFNQIFRNIEAGFVSFRHEAEMAFQKSSSELRIDATISQFTSSMNEQLNSFILGNLPDLEKGRFAEFAAGQKTTDQLLRLRQERQSFDLNQEKEKNDLLRSNAESLSKTFSSEIFQSQEIGRAFRDLALPQIQQGNYDVRDLFDTFTREQNKKAIKEFNESAPDLLGRTFQAEGKTADQVKGTFSMFQTQISSLVRRISAGDVNIAGGGADATERLRDLNDVLIKIRDTSGAVLGDLTKEQEAKIEAAIVNKENSLAQLELNQEIAQEELEISQELAKQKAQVEQKLAVQKAKIDAKNLARTRAAEIASTRLGFAGDIAGATGESRISAIQRGLSDPRQTFGMGLQEITERRIAAERDILEERRAIEDNQLQIEMRQSLLSLNAEVANTKALEKLTSATLTLLSRQLSEDEDVKAISRFRQENAGSESLESDLNSIFSPEAKTRYEALQRINAIQSSGSTELNKQLSKNSNLSFDSLRNTAKGNEELTEQINLLEEQYNTRLKILGIQRDATNDDIKQQNELDRINNTLSGRFQKGVGGMERQSQEILLNLAETAPSRFADGMANALSQVAEGSKSLGDAFTDMAIDFGRMLQQEVFRALAQKAVGSALSGGLGFLGGSQKGGIIKAQNGMYISGGRTGDRNLAMLEDGEYVLNRNAVRMMGGPKSLDTLNYSMAPRFNRGGGFSMSPSLGSDGKFGGDLLLNNRNIGGINSDMFTAYAYENSPYFQGMREDAKKALQRRIQKRFESKQKRAQLVSSVVGAVGSMFMGAAMSGINPAPAGTTVSSPTSLDAIMSGGPRSFAPNAAVPKFMMRPRYNSGGFVPHGSRLSDTIPAMLTGGEYVMNNKAVRKYGLGTMNAINSGSAQGSGASNSNTTNTSTNNNSTNISVSVDRSGNAVYGSNTSSHEQQDIVISKQMAKEISGIVMKNISNEKRYGGALYRS